MAAFEHFSARSKPVCSLNAYGGAAFKLYDGNTSFLVGYYRKALFQTCMFFIRNLVSASETLFSTDGHDIKWYGKSLENCYIFVTDFLYHIAGKVLE